MRARKAVYEVSHSLGRELPVRDVGNALAVPEWIGKFPHPHLKESSAGSVNTRSTSTAAASTSTAARTAPPACTRREALRSALRRLKRDYPATRYAFVIERKGRLTDSPVRRLVGRAGREAGLEFPVHPHMLPHACGYRPADDGQGTRAIQHHLGHNNIQHTVRYTELVPDRFKDFWRD